MWTTIITSLKNLPSLIKDNPHVLNAILFSVILILTYLLVNNPQDQVVKEVIRRDTVTTVKVDTIETEKIRYVVEVDSIPVPDTIEDEENEIPLNNYTTPFSDSRLSGEIHSRVRGYLLRQSFSYTPNFPKYIQFTKDTIIRDYQRTTIIKNDRSIAIGATTYGNLNNQGVFGELSYVSPRRDIYTVGYDPINESVSFGISINIFKF